jgi:hypothetical protein
MFITDEDGVNCIMFGTGDIEIAAGLLDILNNTIGSVALIPRNPSKIGTITDYGECVLDTMRNVHTRLTFNKIESIDVLIKYLQEAKRCMIADNHQNKF